MKRFLFFNLLLMLQTLSFSQGVELPAQLAPWETSLIPAYRESRVAASAGYTNPPGVPVRTMAEWEEIDKLCVTWTSYPSILKEIVRHAKDECTVLIVCSDSNNVKNYLANNGINTVNVEFLIDQYNSVWCRDYGANTVYGNDVDSLMLVDWIYNRPRPKDDVIPQAISNYTGIPLFETTTPPYDLVNTGGNFNTDGFGSAFCSNLVLDENGPNGQFNITIKNEQEVDSIMKMFMGIDRYIKMDNLPYDLIHHIDMHMKLLDEQTLLVGEFPQNVSDGPQIEANLQYVLSNFNSVFGTPYKVIRIPMPPSQSGQYAPNASYRTYTNSEFVNGTLLVPTYYEEYDTTALRILKKALPGYKIIGINSEQIIPASGAIHCITKAIGVADPLLISHQPLEDTYDTVNAYTVDAYINHKSGIASADIYYTTDTTLGFQAVNMTLTNSQTNTWTAYIPPQSGGSEVYYYIHATANSGKQQLRPIVAPDGWWKFNVLPWTGVSDLNTLTGLLAIYPNPASAITCIPVNVENRSEHVVIKVADIFGRELLTVFDGLSKRGLNNYFIDASRLPRGVYFIELLKGDGVQMQKLIVR